MGPEQAVCYDGVMDDFKVGDYVTLSARGDVWRVVKVDPLGGYVAAEDMLHLEWVAGTQNPGRQVRFGSGTARKLTELEVIAVASK